MNIFFKLINGFNTTLKRVMDLSSAKRQFLADITVFANEKALLNKISLQVHPNNGIYQGNVAHYLSVG